MKPEHASFRVMVKKTIMDNIDQNVSFYDNFDLCFSEESFIPKNYAFIMRSLVSSEQTIYALDTPVDDRKIDQYLNFCSKKIARAFEEETHDDELELSKNKTLSWVELPEHNAFYLSHELDHIYPFFSPNQVIAIAIGDFDLETMSDLLNKKLSAELEKGNYRNENEFDAIDQEINSIPKMRRTSTGITISTAFP